MKLLRVLFLAATLLPALASAQWQWIDNDGRKVFSDRAPPAEIPARNILRQPGGKAPPPAEAEQARAVASAPAVARVITSGPKISGKDKTLEHRKKQAEQELETKKKAEEEKLAAEKAQYCDRSQRALKVLRGGERIRAPNAKGELEYMSDEQRAAESKRLQAATADCKS